MDADALVEHYRPGRSPWLRANMVASADGAAAGSDGLSGSISTGADKAVFSVLRSWADAVLVAAGTVRAEGYTRLSVKPDYRGYREDRGQSPAPTLAIVSRTARLDYDRLNSRPGGGIRLYTNAAAPGLPEARRRLGAEEIAVADDDWGVADLLADLHASGRAHVLCEGGPGYLAEVAATGALDELCLTIAPRLIGGAAGRILQGADAGRPLRLMGLLESESTLVARYARAD